MFAAVLETERVTSSDSILRLISLLISFPATRWRHSTFYPNFKGRQCQEYTKNTWIVDKKLAIRQTAKEQLALTVRGERRLRRIVRSQRNQTLAQITTQLNDGASRTVSKWTAQSSLHRMGFESRRPKRVPLLNARHWAACLAWGREHKDWSVNDWIRVAWSDEFRLQLLNADGRLRIWHQAHDDMDPACQFGTVRGYGGIIKVYTVWDLWCVY
ncbi:HTH_Tnp_Tc3_2 domain-containing protein [Trichonephila clavipes]|nr:HTH_Tnp_Tc3_2 domain-containing protein [Trichonephila clavipes]